MEVFVRWCDWEGEGLEHCAYVHGEGGLILEGVVAGTREGRYGARYIVRTDADFRTREARVEYVAGPRLHVEADGEGNWRDLIGGAPIASLKDCLDVDIGVTPATNTLPIKRLKLTEKESGDIAAAYVPLPSEIKGEFLPRRVEQRYTCLAPGRRYLYEDRSGAFAAELEVNRFGLVLDYPGLFRRVRSS